MVLSSAKSFGTFEEMAGIDGKDTALKGIHPQILTQRNKVGCKAGLSFKTIILSSTSA